MKHIKLYEDSITYPIGNLKEIVSVAEELMNTAIKFVKGHANIIAVLTLSDVNSNLKKYKEMVDKLDKTKTYLEQQQSKYNNIIDMYPMIPSERPAGVHELVNKLEYTINRSLDDNCIEIDELKEFIEHLIYFVEHQTNHEIIKNALK